MSSLVFEFAKTTLSKALGKDAYPATFNIGERLNYQSRFQSIWNVHKGVKKDDGSSITVFVYDQMRYPELVHLARNAVKRFKTIKHPMILKLIDVHETDALIAIATESATPLPCYIDRNRATEKDAICFGLFRVASVLEFLQEKAKLIHGNIRMDSVFVTASGEWKLGGLEVLSGSDPSSINFLSTSITRLPDMSSYLSPPVKNGTSLPDLGSLIWEVFNGKLTNLENLHDTSLIPNTLLASYRKLIHPDSRQQINLTTFIEENSMKRGYFDNEIIHMSTFLENIAIKEAFEKEAFLKQLDTSVDKLPVPFAKYKVLPELLNALEYGGAGTKALVPILKISTKMDQKEFDQKITPVIVKLFASTDRVLRVALCEHLGKLSEHLNSKSVNDNIFPNLAIVRESTLKAVVSILPKLSEKIVNNDLLRHLAKLQSDEQAGIRTNTTICLGKMCKYLNDATKKRVLIPAFTRSLQDPFPPARTAGLLALSATVESYEAADIAHRLIPMISPLTMDMDVNVKKQAVLALDNLFKKLKGSVAEAIEQQQKDMEKQSAQSSNPNSPNPVSTKKDDSWGSWATSLSSRLVSGKEIPVAADVSQSPKQSPQAIQVVDKPSLVPTLMTPVVSLPMSISNSSTTNQMGSSTSTGSFTTAPKTSPPSNPGWDDEFGFDEEDDDWGKSNVQNARIGPTVSSERQLSLSGTSLGGSVQNPLSSSSLTSLPVTTTTTSSNTQGWNDAFEEW